jgi:hypothetical protein
MKGMKKKGKGSGTAMAMGMKQIAIVALILVAFVSTPSLALAAEITINPPDPTVGDPITINGTGFNGTVTIKTTVTCWKPIVDDECQCTIENFEIPNGTKFTLVVREVKDNVTLYIKKGIWWEVNPSTTSFFTFVYDSTNHTSTVTSGKITGLLATTYSIDVIGDAQGDKENCTMVTTADFEVTADGGNFSETFNTQGIPISSFTLNATDEYGTSAENTTNLTLEGDASRDGQINAYDCCCIARYVAEIPGYDNNTISVNAAKELAGKCDKVDIEDAWCLARFLIEKEPTIPCGCTP